MSIASAKFPHRVPQGMTPTYHLSDAQLAPVLAALPPLLPHAPPDWHRSRQKKIVKEIAALQPADALQARLAGNIVVLRHQAASAMSWANVRTNSPEQARRLGREAAMLMGVGDRLEHALRRQRKRTGAPGGGWAGDGGEAAPGGNAGPRNDVMQRLPPGTCPGGEPADGWGAPPSPAPLRDATSPAERARCRPQRGDAPATGADA